MKIPSKKIGAVLGLWTAASLYQATAADWPQWRGPQRNGISEETGLAAEWPASGPKLVWQISDAGAGFSTPAVVGEYLYFLSNDGVENETIEARSATDGKKVWSTKLGKVGNPDQKPAYPAARSTPTVDGSSIYALGSDGDLVCVGTADGKILWQKSLRKDFGGEPGVWAYAESPLIDGDTLICTPGGKEATVVALNKKTGETIWKAALPDGDQAGYASAIVLETGGVKQYVQFLQKGLVGLDAKTGKLLWRYDKTSKNSPANIPSPVAADNAIYSASGRGGGGLVKIKADQGALSADPVYAEMKLPSSIGGTVKIGDNLYGTGSTGLMCVDFASGKVLWQDRSIGSASILAADHRLYLHGENGDVALVEATPEGYREKGKFTPPNPPDRGSAKAWTYPVLADGRLYIRDGGSLWCFDVKAK